MDHFYMHNYLLLIIHILVKQEILLMQINIIEVMLLVDQENLNKL